MNRQQHQHEKWMKYALQEAEKAFNIKDLGRRAPPKKSNDIKGLATRARNKIAQIGQTKQ